MYTQTSAYMSTHTLPQIASQPNIPPTVPSYTAPNHTPAHTHTFLTYVPDIPDSLIPSILFLYTLETPVLQTAPQLLTHLTSDTLNTQSYSLNS